MPAYEFTIVNVFTDAGRGGNPLAVLPDAAGLTEAQMQTIATGFDLSETTFVLPPADPRNHAQVRIFNRRREMPFAGHPNVGTGYVLANMAGDPPEHFTFEQPAGLVRVHILRDADQTISGARVAAPRSLTIDIAIPENVVAACAGLDAADIVTRSHTPLVASVGTPFVIAEVAGLQALARARPDIDAFEAAVSRFSELDGHFALHLYAWGDEPADDTQQRRIRCRMFAPLDGTAEDPATGSANAALAALLTSLAPGDNVDLMYPIEQGVEMGSPSLIIASAVKTAEGPVSASVAGSCTTMRQGTLQV